MWPKGDDYTRGPYTIYTIFLVTFMITHILSQIFLMYEKRDDLQIITGTVYVFVTEMVCILKIYCVVANMGMLKSLLKTLKTDMFQPKNLVQISDIKENIKVWKIFYKLYVYLCYSWNALILAYPLLG